MKWIILVVIIIISSCSPEQVAQPRPYQYPRINFPDQTYVAYKDKECPFTMDIPSYAKVKQKKLLFDEIEADPCWFDISLDLFHATIHCSYYALHNDKKLDTLVIEAFKMADKHNIKASHREEYLIKNKAGHSGLMFKINGPVATPFQFYMTDSTDHFLRGSLYFDVRVDQDSILPIINFIEKDLDRLLVSLEYR